MYQSFNTYNDNPCDCSSDFTSDSEESCAFELPNSCKNNSTRRNCTCCECKKNKKPLAKGKFGLAYVIETSKQKITKPTGWQVEFQDTPSRIVNNCEKMVKWVNCPPLGSCSDTIPIFSESPKTCIKLLKETKPKKRNKSPKCCCTPAEGIVQCSKSIKNYSEPQQPECSCSKYGDNERVCIICEKCKVNTSSLISPYKNKCYCERRPHTSTRPTCCCEQVKSFTNKRCRCPTCPGCCNCVNNQQMKPNFFREKQSNFKYFKNEDDLDYIPKRESTMEGKNAHTQCQKKCIENYKGDYNQIKNIIKVCDKEIETKNDAKIADKIKAVSIKVAEKGIDTKTKEIRVTSSGNIFENVSDIRISNKVKIYSKDKGDKKVYRISDVGLIARNSFDEIEKRFKSNSKILKIKEEKNPQHLNFIENKTVVPRESVTMKKEEKLNENKSQDVNIPQLTSVTTEQIEDKTKNINEEENQNGDKNDKRKNFDNINQEKTLEIEQNLEETNIESEKEVETTELEENRTENTDNNENLQNEDNNLRTIYSSDLYQILKYRHLRNKGLFTPDMTPIQKIKLALKIQKYELLVSKINNSEVPEIKIVDEINNTWNQISEFISKK